MLDLQSDNQHPHSTNPTQVVATHCSHPESLESISETLSLRTILDNIDRILRIQSKAHSKQQKHHYAEHKRTNNNSGDRQKYRELLSWHQKCLADIKMQTKASQITLYNCIQQQHSILLATMHKLCEEFSKECDQKGLLIKVLTMQHFYLHQSLTQYIDNRLRANLTERVFTQSKMESQYAEQTRLLKEELQSLKEGKDKKWRNLFMLIKDNRILRRTKGKLMRQLQASLYRQQQYKENIIQLSKQNERYKLLSHSSVYEENGIQKWLKNLSSLIKIERYVQKQPFKAKRILQFELENLQIDEMEALPQKIEYVIKAIEEAEELVDYYEDLNDLIAPCKLLLNNCTQTEVESESIGTNTPSVKYLNAYVQVKPALLLRNNCRIVSNTCKFNNLDKNYRKSNGDGYKRNDSTLSERNDSNYGSYLGNHYGNARARGKYHEFSTMLTVNQKIVPTYTVLNQKHHNYVYKDSKFAAKLFMSYQQVQVKINGLQGFGGETKHNLSKPKHHLIQKRYTQQGRQISALTQQLLLSFKAENNAKSKTKVNTSLNEVDQLQSTPVWVNRSSSKRYSYNSRIMPIQKKYSTTKTDDFSISGSDIHNLTNRIGETEPKIESEQPLKLCKPCEQTEKPEPLMQISQPKINNHKNTSDPDNTKKKGKEIEQKGVDDQSIIVKQRVKQTKLEKTKERIQKITKGVKMTTGKSAQPHNLSGFGKLNRNSHSSEISSMSNNCQSEENSGKVKIIERKSIMNKRNSHKILSSMALQDFKMQQYSATNVRCLGDSQVQVDSCSDNSRMHGGSNFTNACLASHVNMNSSNSRGQKYPERNCSNFSINLRASYQVAPIVQQDVLEENNLPEDQMNAHEKQLLSQEPLILKYNPVELEPETSQVDAQKIILKVLHLLFINRIELKQSQKTLREYMDTNLRNIYGLTPQSQFCSFNKSLAFLPDPSLSAMSFMRLLSHNTPVAYQNDLLKLYLILIDKCSNSALVCQLDKAAKIVEYVTGLFYNEGELGEVTREVLSSLTILSINNSQMGKGHQNNQLNRIAHLSINLNHYFLVLETDLRRFCLQTQFYQFCQQVLPDNQTDLNYQQFSQIVKFLPQNTQLSIHLSRLRLYFSADKPKSSSKTTMGMKIHKISLYCSREKWDDIKNISETIQENFRQVIDQKLCLEELIEMLNKLDKAQFGESKAKTVCPWVYSLARNQIRKYKEYGGKLSKNLLKLIWLIQVNLRVDSLQLLGTHLGMLAKGSRRTIVSKELNEFMGKNKEQKNDGLKGDKRQSKGQETELSFHDSRYLLGASTNYLKSSKTINNAEKKC